MAQHDGVIDNGTGSAVRTDINNALAAINSNNSGGSDPSTTYAYQFYADSGDNTLKIRNAANDGFVNVSITGGIGTENFGLAPLLFMEKISSSPIKSGEFFEINSLLL